LASYKDYYQILGLSRDASERDVRKAFRTLAAKHHPDRNPDDPGAEERFKEVNEAYTVLSDPEKRRFYDQYGTASGPPPFASGGYQGVDPDDAEGFSDFFRSLFGGGFGGFAGAGDFSDFGVATDRGGRRTVRFTTQAGPRMPPRAPRRVEAALELSLEEAFHGGVRTLRVGDTSLDVTVPAGMRDGARLRLRNQAPGGGDLVLVVRHRADPRYRLDGDDLHVRVDVPDFTAALGGSVRVPTLDGPVDMTLPPATQTGRRLRLRERGWPRKGGGRGDALAEVRVVIPERPSAEQRQLYERLRDEADGASSGPRA
jgi:curved DNA-binding protein